MSVERVRRLAHQRLDDDGTEESTHAPALQYVDCTIRYDHTQQRTLQSVRTSQWKLGQVGASLTQPCACH